MMSKPTQHIDTVFRERFENHTGNHYNDGLWADFEAQLDAQQGTQIAPVKGTRFPAAAKLLTFFGGFAILVVAGVWLGWGSTPEKGSQTNAAPAQESTSNAVPEPENPSSVAASEVQEPNASNALPAVVRANDNAESVTDREPRLALDHATPINASPFVLQPSDTLVTLPANAQRTTKVLDSLQQIEQRKKPPIPINDKAF